MSPHQHEHPDAEPSSPSPALFDTDNEHDQRVRRRLTELAAEHGCSVEEVLQELNARLAGGQPPVAETSGAAPAGRLVGRPHVVRRRPADDVWGVVSVAYDGPPAAFRRPCTGQEPCPWRRDAPRDSSRQKRSSTPRRAIGPAAHRVGSAATPARRRSLWCAPAGCWPAPTATTRSWR